MTEESLEKELARGRITKSPEGKVLLQCTYSSPDAVRKMADGEIVILSRATYTALRQRASPKEEPSVRLPMSREMQEAFPFKVTLQEQGASGAETSFFLEPYFVSSTACPDRLTVEYKSVDGALASEDWRKFP